jgi:hypothetical protein
MRPVTFYRHAKAHRPGIVYALGLRARTQAPFLLPQTVFDWRVLSCGLLLYLQV